MYRHFPGYILLNVDNRPHDFASMPRTLHQLYIDNGMGGMGTSNHYAFGSYDINIGQAHGALGHVIVQIMEIPWGHQTTTEQLQCLADVLARGCADRRRGSIVTRTT
jgi:hypothetical protein